MKKLALPGIPFLVPDPAYSLQDISFFIDIFATFRPLLGSIYADIMTNFV